LPTCTHKSLTVLNSKPLPFPGATLLKKTANFKSRCPKLRPYGKMELERQKHESRYFLINHQ
jgi:hypothetical protein